jgi:histidine ammonia-lyase
LEYHAPLAPGVGVRQAYQIVRKLVAPLTTDRSMSKDIESIRDAIVSDKFAGL